jgi:uncharacterized surface protein with fasciclin (FAS1) repeats
MKNKTGKLMVVAMLPVLLYLSACTKTYSTATDGSLAQQRPSQSLLDYLKNNYAFSIFYAGLRKTGLDKQIDGNTKFTLLLPDNDAFARVNITQDSLLRMDTAYLRKWIGFHIVQGDIGFDSVPQAGDNAFFSILGQKIFLSKPITQTPQSTRVLYANGTNINSFDIQAANGYIQVLNTPLNAPVEGNLQDFIDAHLDQFSLFKASLQQCKLWDRLKSDTGSPLTIFAPVNDAFQNIGVYDPEVGYAVYNITADTIATWDGAAMPKDIFGIYVFPGRIFTGDLVGVSVNYIMPDQQVTLNFTQNGMLSQVLGNFGNWLKEPYSQPTITVMSPGNNYVTLNGNNVLQPVNALFMIPNNQIK